MPSFMSPLRLYLNKNRTRELILITVFLAPSLTVFTLYRIIPLIWNLILSFQKWSLFGGTSWIGWLNYEDMFYDEVFWEALKNTIMLFSGAPVAIVLALGIALLVNMPLRGRNIHRAIVFLPYPLMTVAIGIVWRWMYDEKVGFFNFALRSAGLTDKGVPFLDSFEYSLLSIIFTYIWQIVGFFMVIILTGLQTIPAELHEAAAIDGAGPMRRFWYITLPLLKSTFFLCFIIGIINSFTSFDLIYVMTGGGPGHSSEILVTYIYKAAFVLNRLDYGAALTVVLFVMLLAITWLINRLTGGNAGAVSYYE